MTRILRRMSLPFAALLVVVGLVAPARTVLAPVALCSLAFALCLLWRWPEPSLTRRMFPAPRDAGRLDQ